MIIALPGADGVPGMTGVMGGTGDYSLAGRHHQAL
jgi:hypothetical protein